MAGPAARCGPFEQNAGPENKWAACAGHEFIAAARRCARSARRFESAMVLLHSGAHGPRQWVEFQVSGCRERARKK